MTMEEIPADAPAPLPLDLRTYARMWHNLEEGAVFLTELRAALACLWKHQGAALPAACEAEAMEGLAMEPLPPALQTVVDLKADIGALQAFVVKATEHQASFETAARFYLRMLLEDLQHRLEKILSAVQARNLHAAGRGRAALSGGTVLAWQPEVLRRAVREMLPVLAHPARPLPQAADLQPLMEWILEQEAVFQPKPPAEPEPWQYRAGGRNRPRGNAALGAAALTRRA